jgi:SAM-dependent methyltransferase
MKKAQIKVTKVYYKEEPGRKLDLDFDPKHPEEPHWIYLKSGPQPRFLSVKTPKNSEVIYKSFGQYYYPVNTIPSPEVQNCLMKATAYQYDEIVGDLNVKIADFIYEKVEYLDLSPDIQIIDLGAGTGLTSIPFVKNGYENITLVDIAEEMQEVALSKEVLKNVNYILQDVRELKLNQKFDLVISGMFLCDLTSKGRIKAFESLVPLLNDNAYIVLVEDEKREIYYQYFEEIDSGMAAFNEYEKFYFVGKKK